MPDPVRSWAHQVHVHRGPAGTRVVAVRRLGPEVGDRLGLHLALFAAAFISATVSGGFLEGVDALGTRFSNIGGTWVPVPTGVDLRRLLVGLPFSL
ncbi:MAG: hypothetical protein OEO23_04090, partial [Gemmatimonadota bacterium]|nr:hypothetical protein [Gemmatimonadota bacterium]